MIEFITNNFTTISNFVMAIATFLMVYYSKKSIDEMKLTREESNSAEVIVYFKVDTHRMYLIIENVGNTVAKNVNIKIEPELKDSTNNEINLNEISFLPPNYKIKHFFDMTHSYYNKYHEYPKNKFIITYENIYEKTIERNYESNLDYLKEIDFLTSESETVEMSLYKIRKEFHQTNKKLDSIKKD